MDEFNWLVLEDGCAVAGFVSRNDAEQFIEQCGYDAMKTVAAKTRQAESALRQLRQRRKVVGQPGRTNSRVVHR